jgi:MoaA/NifB/PqqE/SkfB family radical SAM enzyme
MLKIMAKPIRALLTLALGSTARTRFVLALMERSTPRRLLNLAVTEISRWTKRKALRSYPSLVMVDVTSACNLACPFCKTGKKARGRRPAMLHMDDYIRLMDEIGKYLYIVAFYVDGEPVLNPRFPEFVKIAVAHGVFTSTSSNATLITPEIADQLVAAGLDHISLAIDGTTQEIYEIYRRKGKLADAIDGLRNLVEAKRRQGRSKPYIEWQFIVFRHNEHQLAEARELAHKLGADGFEPIPSYVEDASWEPQDPRFRRSAYDFETQTAVNCRWPYSNLVLHPDGGISSCCWTYHEPFDFGHVRDIQNGGFHALWNNPNFQSSRGIIDLDYDHPRPHPRGPAKICELCREGVRPHSLTFEEALQIVPEELRAPRPAADEAPPSK